MAFYLKLVIVFLRKCKAMLHDQYGWTHASQQMHLQNELVIKSSSTGPSYQNAICYGKDVYDFEQKNKEKFGKCSAYGFSEAMAEIENNLDIDFRGVLASIADMKTSECPLFAERPKKKKQKRKNSKFLQGDEEEPSSKHSKIVDVPTHIQLVKPCFVKLERLNLDAYYI
jgi:hypothetical protein